MNELMVLVAVGALIAVGFAVFALIRGRAGDDVNAENPAAPIELLRVDLEPASHQLRVRIAERPIASADEIADERLRIVVQSLLKLLTPEKVEPESVTPQATLPEPPAEVSQALPLPADDLSAPFLMRLLESLRRQRHYPPMGAKASPTAKKMGTQQAETKPAADVFAQVNTILQDKLHAQPDLQWVEVIGEGGELHIRMGEQTYLQIDVVPDERVRELIRVAIAEWEAKQF